MSRGERLGRAHENLVTPGMAKGGTSSFASQAYCGGTRVAVVVANDSFSDGAYALRADDLGRDVVGAVGLLPAVVEILHAKMQWGEAWMVAKT
jgi:hypothetical protein